MPLLMLLPGSAVLVALEGSIKDRCSFLSSSCNGRTEISVVACSITRTTRPVSTADTILYPRVACPLGPGRPLTRLLWDDSVPACVGGLASLLLSCSYPPGQQPA